MNRKIIGILIIAIPLGILFISMLVDFYLDENPPLLTDVSDYEIYVDEVYNADTFMPDLDVLPNYEDVEVYYDNRASKSITLSVIYSNEDYESAKESIINMYSFLDGPIKDETGFYYIPSHEFDYKSYQIKVVDNEDFSYPEQFGMIGFSDDYNRICFLFFYDRSLNSLGNSYTIEDFLKDNFEFPTLYNNWDG